MLDTPRDILYLVISFCVLWVTVFLCWTFYYVMRLLRNANKIVEEFRVRLQALTEAINYIRGKVEHMSSLLTIASEGVGGLIKKAVSRKAEAWVHEGSERFNAAAKDAVERAVKATKKKLKKTRKKL